MEATHDKNFDSKNEQNEKNWHVLHSTLFSPFYSRFLKDRRTHYVVVFFADPNFILRMQSIPFHLCRVHIYAFVLLSGIDAHVYTDITGRKTIRDKSI